LNISGVPVFPISNIYIRIKPSHRTSQNINEILENPENPLIASRPNRS
jgi:hypothetical protein